MAFQAIHGEFKVERHDIGWAAGQLRAGFQVTRKGWNGKGQFIQLERSHPQSKMTLNYIYICTVQGALVPWVCSQTDFLAEDWEMA